MGFLECLSILLGIFLCVCIPKIATGAIFQPEDSTKEVSIGLNYIVKVSLFEDATEIKQKMLRGREDIDISNENTKPQTADEVQPSPDLKDIIDRIKNQTIPTASEAHKNKEAEQISESTRNIIKTQGNATAADKVAPSPALRAVLSAYHNGSLNYSKQTAEEEQIYFHQVYADISLDSIYDLTILRTGQDIFLSLGYQPLMQSQRVQPDNSSQKIKELQQTIFAIKRREAKKTGLLTKEEIELERIKQASKSTMSPRKLMTERILSFFGIKRKKIEDNYEEMAHSYHLYKQWSERWQRWDKMIMNKKTRRYKVAPAASQYEKSINNNKDNLIQPYGKQLQITPYSNGNVIFSKPNKF